MSIFLGFAASQVSRLSLTFTFRFRHSLHATVTCRRFLWSFDRCWPVEEEDAEGLPDVSSVRCLFAVDMVHARYDRLRTRDYAESVRLEPWFLQQKPQIR